MEGSEDRAEVLTGEAVHLAGATEQATVAPEEGDEARQVLADDMAEDTQALDGEALVTDAALRATAEAAAEEQPALVYDTLGPEHAALKEFVADAGQRPVLAGICVRDGQAVVTNGSILVIVPTGRQAATDLPVIDGMATPLSEGTEVLVPVAAIEKALRLVDKKTSVMALQRVVLSYAPAENGEGPKALLSATDLETSGTIAVRPISGKFPTYEQVIPVRDGKCKVAINAGLLRQLATYIERHGGGTGTMTIYIDPANALSPLRVEFGPPDRPGVAVLAPMRVYG